MCPIACFAVVITELGGAEILPSRQEARLVDSLNELKVTAKNER